MQMAVFILSMSLLHATSDSVAGALSTQVRADLLNHRVVEELKEQNLEQVLRSMDEYYGLEKEGATIPAPLRLLDAQTAFKVGQPTRALCALEAYLNNADRNNEADQYAQALKAYGSYVSAAKSTEGSAEAQAASDYCKDRRRISEANLPAPQPATVFFLRGGNYKIGYRWNMLVGAEEKVLGTLPNSSVVEIKVTPGRHKFFARWQPHELPDTDIGEIDLEVTAGAIYYLKAYCDKNSFTRAPVHLEQIDESAARSAWQLP